MCWSYFLAATAHHDCLTLSLSLSLSQPRQLMHQCSCRRRNVKQLLNEFTSIYFLSVFLRLLFLSLVFFFCWTAPRASLP